MTPTTTERRPVATAEVNLSSKMERFDSFWKGSAGIERGYESVGQFYKANYLKHLPENREARMLVISCRPGYFVNLLNQRLKRTEFMPFAPAVLAEDRHLYFKHLEGAEDMKRTCPGVVHVDGTARPQLVSESDNPAYYRIIQEFKKITGLSCIVNTRFNIHEDLSSAHARRRDSRL